MAGAEKAKISDNMSNVIDNYTAHSDSADEDAQKVPSLVKLDKSLCTYFKTFVKAPQSKVCSLT